MGSKSVWLWSPSPHHTPQRTRWWRPSNATEGPGRLCPRQRLAASCLVPRLCARSLGKQNVLLKNTVRCCITQMQDLWSAYEVNQEQTQRKEKRNKKQNTFILTLKIIQRRMSFFGQNSTLDNLAWKKKSGNSSTGYSYDDSLLDENNDHLSRRSNNPWFWI